MVFIYSMCFEFSIKSAVLGSDFGLNVVLLFCLDLLALEGL
ncbi:hypothetical protein ADICYQ_5008 [Cyclobacterium qasimii M12-11B]|uniref:Uncharacterized protein n=1 Tax=Cyclobacterium qasimii M12-11B TaxID=641524 RepID=S7WPA2_9BACT|nr:hypothetical protein ADICYQ_5008 [Cyclobacterium qasimii M12-11B]